MIGHGTPLVVYKTAGEKPGGNGTTGRLSVDCGSDPSLIMLIGIQYRRKSRFYDKILKLSPTGELTDGVPRNVSSIHVLIIMSAKEMGLLLKNLSDRF